MRNNAYLNITFILESYSSRTCVIIFMWHIFPKSTTTVISKYGENSGRKPIRLFKFRSPWEPISILKVDQSNINKLPYLCNWNFLARTSPLIVCNLGLHIQVEQY